MSVIQILLATFPVINILFQHTCNQIAYWTKLAVTQNKSFHVVCININTYRVKLGNVMNSWYVQSSPQETQRKENKRLTLSNVLNYWCVITGLPCHVS